MCRLVCSIRIDQRYSILENLRGLCEIIVTVVLQELENISFSIKLQKLMEGVEEAQSFLHWFFLYLSGGKCKGRSRAI